MAQHRVRLRGDTLRRWPRRVLIVTNVIVAVLLIGSGSIYGYATWRLRQVRRIYIPSIHRGAAVATSDATLGATGGATEAPGSAMTILVVGSDSRAGNTGSDTALFGTAAQVAGQRSDTIMLVRVDPKSTKASLLSIPRDLWVQIPGKNFEQRINTTFDTGPDLLVRAIQQDLGIPVDHYVEVSFQSFRQIVNAVGGVKEYFPTPARDVFSALRINNPGCSTMNGQMALDFVRARHYEYYANGRWHFEAESDLARINRQQSFIKKMINKVQIAGLTNPLELNGVISGITNNLTVDSGFSANLMLSLGRRFRSLSPDSLPAATLPTTPAVIQGNDVLLLQQPQARQAIAAFLGTGQQPTTAAAPSNILPSHVRVAVLNGSGRPGEASQAQAALSRQGFAVTNIGSANNYGYATTVIRYAPGNQEKARVLASIIVGSAQLDLDSSIVNADVVLITGQTYGGIKTGTPAGGSQSPATSAPPPAASTQPAIPPTTTYELPGTPSGFVAPAC